jgi:hypothetical protein
MVRRNLSVRAIGLFAGLAFTALLFSLVFAQSTPVPPTKASAKPTLDGRVTVTDVIPGQTGDYSRSATFDGGTGKEKTNTNPPSNDLTMTVKYDGRKDFNYIEPEGADGRSIKVEFHDESVEEMRINLKVEFPATASTSYTVKWQTLEMTAKWNVKIILPKDSSSGDARWQAFARTPWDPAGQPGASEIIYVNQDGYWEHTKVGPVAFAREEVSGTLTPGAGFSNLDKDFTFTAGASGSLTHEALASVRVVINHGVAASAGNGTDRYESKTDGSPNWEIVNKLNVSITTP